MTSTEDVNAGESETVKVWVSTGRDQAKIINRLISDNAEKLVTSDGKRISIQLSMVDTGATLIRATLAGKRTGLRTYDRRGYAHESCCARRFASSDFI